MVTERVIESTARLRSRPRIARWGATASALVIVSTVSTTAWARAAEPPPASSASATVATPSDAPADASPEPSRISRRVSERLPAHLDFEIDPIAFGLKGFSLHSGIRWHHFRLDLGVFGLENPQALSPDDRFTTRFAGFGAKLDYRFFGGGDGPFAGLSTGVARVSTLHRSSGLASVHHEFDVSARVGYEFDVAGGFYVVPWVSVGARFGSREVTLAGDTLEANSRLFVFPTVHLGYRFQRSKIVRDRRAERARQRAARRANKR